MDEILLQLENIEKQFFGVRVLNHVNLSLQKGRILGLVGENGAGKSTLMNIMGGVFPPDEGRMMFCGSAYAPQTPAESFAKGVAFVHQELNLFTNLSVAENLFIHSFPTKRLFNIPFVDSGGIRSKTALFLELVNLHVSPDTLVEDLPPGERQLVEIAKALSVDARLIIFDEPTTSLTASEITHLFRLIERLQSEGISMIYISHALGDVMKLCDDIVVLRDGRVVGAGRTCEFTIESIVSLMIGRDLSQIYPPRSNVSLGGILLEVDSVSQPGIVNQITFSLHQGEILGISGLMGAGRSELARILFGLDPFQEGRIYLRGKRRKHPAPRESIRMGLAFLSENRREEGLMMEASIADNMALVSLPSFTRKPSYLIDDDRMNLRLQRMSNSVRLRCASLEKQTAKMLSGGNQQKLVLAKWLLQIPSVLILDEPTRGIDVGAKYEIYGLMNDLASQGNGILFISSEIEELVGMCDRILVMRNGQIVDRFEKEDFDAERILRCALGEMG